MRLRDEIHPMFALALPLAAGEVGWMFMGVVDTVMVGHMPNAAIAMSSVALAQICFNTLTFGIGGVLLGLDALIPQARGAGNLDEANRWLIHGLYLATAVSALLMTIFGLAPLAMRHLHTDPQVLAGSIGTLKALNAGVLPLLAYFTLRRYMQAFSHARSIAAALITANLINFAADWLLIFDHHWHIGGATIGWTGLGVTGSGWATSFARLYMALFLATAALLANRRHNYGLLKTSLRAEWLWLKRAIALGAPAGATILIEIAVFAVVTALCAALGPVPLAGHEIALNVCSLTFMVPMGISAAASVRVGHAIGAGDPAAARSAGWTAMLFSGSIMLTAAAAFVLAPAMIARIYTPSTEVIAATVPLLLVAAIFQFCDGIQVTAIGALRGAGDTKSGLITHLCTYWLLGLPLGILLCFHFKMGARGLWIGLCTALVLAGTILLYRWRIVSRRLSPPKISSS